MSPKVTDEHKEIRSKAILLAAKEVFSRKGYGSTTMKDIVLESGMSRGSVYMYFSSTEAMMLALIAEEDQENNGQLDALVRDSESTWSLLVALLQGSEASITEITSGFAAAIYEFYLTQWRISGNTTSLEQRYDTAVATFSALLQLGIDRGEFHPISPPTDISRIVVSLLDGMTLDCTYLGPHKMKLREQLDISLKLLEALLKPTIIPSINEGADH